MDFETKVRARSSNGTKTYYLPLPKKLFDLHKLKVDKTYLVRLTELKAK